MTDKKIAYIALCSLRKKGFCRVAEEGEKNRKADEEGKRRGMGILSDLLVGLVVVVGLLIGRLIGEAIVRAVNFSYFSIVLDALLEADNASNALFRI